MWHAYERREKCTRFCWERPNERGHSKYRSVNERMGSEWILRRLAGRKGGGGCDFKWLSIGTGGEFL
jgi:hypothetical protein